MIRTRILTEDREMKRRTLHHFDDNTGLTTIETQYDVEPVVETNKLMANASDDIASASAKGGEMVRVASIPIGLWMELKQKGIIDDPVAYRRWLNDPENRFFRTTPGRV